MISIRTQRVKDLLWRPYFSFWQGGQSAGYVTTMTFFFLFFHKLHDSERRLFIHPIFPGHGCIRTRLFTLLFPSLAIAELPTSVVEMKLSYSHLFTILVTGVINRVQGAGFAAYCAVSSELIDTSYLQAACANEAGANVDTELDLDLCFWNDDGVLKAGNG